jgi:hypothetical protein
MRRSVLLPVVAALFAMLLGMASPALAREGATPVVPTPSPTATSNYSATITESSDLFAKQPEVRMTRDGSRPLTPAEIAHDDELWAPVIEQFDGMVEWFVTQCAVNWPTQPFIAQQLSNGSSLKDAWSAAYNGDLGSLHSHWGEFFYNVKPLYAKALEASIGTPPALWDSWTVDPLPYPWEFAGYMDQLYPGCSTGTSSFHW